MIIFTKVKVKQAGGCNACSRLQIGKQVDTYYPYQKVTEIILSSNEGNTGLSFRLCDKCLKELKKRL